MPPHLIILLLDTDKTKAIIDLSHPAYFSSMSAELKVGLEGNSQ